MNSEQSKWMKLFYFIFEPRTRDKRSSNEMTATELLNQILYTNLEWGPNGCIPVVERIQKKYPELALEEINRMNAWCDEASKYAFRLIYDEYGNGMRRGRKEILAQIRSQYPEIDQANLSDIYTKGMYYACR